VSSRKLPFITWLKAVGMLLIIYGHSGAWLVGAKLPPINTKQLGVAFFVFITGVTLAKETRPAREILARRICEVYLFALAVALICSAIGAVWDGNLLESNYLPLLFGANVVVDAFPANPTTWYVGTYLHLLLVATFLHRRWEPEPWHVLLVAVGEIALRAYLLSLGLTFVPYMLLTNWLSLYFLGRLWGRGLGGLKRSATAVTGVAVAVGMLIALPPLAPAFPFFVPARPSVVGLALVSATISLLYAASTLAAAQLFSSIGARVPAAIQFIADHTLLIFLAHMPICFALAPIATEYLGEWRALALFAASIAIPGAVSVIVHRTLNVERLRSAAAAWSRLPGGRLNSARTT
jgi:peptidoglycan/LPS O-acetylase OafA/YrhL